MPPTSWKDPLEDLQRELGALSMEMARLETALGCAVAFLANPTDVRIGHILVAELSFRALLTAFSSLYPERVGAALNEDRLRSFRTDVHAAETARNTLIHSFYWSGAVGESRATRIKTTAKEKHGLRLQFEDVTPSSVSEQTKAIRSLTEQLDELLLEPFDDYTNYTGRFYAFFAPENVA